MSEAINNMPVWMGEGKQGDLKIRFYKGLLVFMKEKKKKKKTPAIVSFFKLFILVLFQLFDPIFFQ